MIKNKIILSSLREIKTSFPRFISLLMMSLLGVFVYAGLNATAPFMISSLDSYLDSDSIYDISLVSSIGFDEKSIEPLKKTDGISSVELANFVDVSFLGKNDTEYTVRLHSKQYLNNIIDVDPKDNELYVSQNFLDVTGYHIGDKVTLDSSDLAYQEFMIKGVVDSALYFNNASLSNSVGKTNIGNGTLNFYAFVSQGAITVDYYKIIYITVDGAIEEETNSKNYNELIDEVKALIISQESSILLSRKETLTDSLSNLKAVVNQYDEAINLIDEAKKEKKELDEVIEQKGFDSIESYLEEYQKSTTLTEEDQLLYQRIINYESSSLIARLIEEAIQGKSKSELENNVETLEKTIQNASITYQDRLSNSTYKDYIDDANSIANLSYLFPIVFFLVAILVSLVSMNRMVEDDRLMIGTFKSLGFSNHQILTKYLLFSLFATLIGGVIGAAGGLLVIPTLINSIYKILFDVPEFLYGLNLKDTLVGFLLSIACICGVTIYTVYKELKESTATLLRPKAPKIGKKIGLEKTKLWKKMKFSNKITIRNLWRYKKRAIVTVLSITGCFALLLCGFGIKDSISGLPEKHYGYIIEEDAMVVCEEMTIENVKEFVNKNTIEDYTPLMSISGSMTKNNTTYEMSIEIVDENYPEFIHFYDLENGENISLKHNEVVITDKLASLLKINKGDTITFTDDDGHSYTYLVSAVIEYYINHAIYMTKETYLENGYDYNINLLYLKLDEDGLNKNDFKKECLQNDKVLNVSYTEDIIENANDMLQSLDKVVLILIVLSGLLSFVVLFNLSTINIQERKREIATLKVLGFYPNEVNRYVTSENVIFTFLGIVLGILVGIIFTNMVVSTVEIVYVRFIHHIKLLSFVYAACFSIFFTFIVNLMTGRSLKQIDMIESLKSVE